MTRSLCRLLLLLALALSLAACGGPAPNGGGLPDASPPDTTEVLPPPAPPEPPPVPEEPEEPPAPTVATLAVCGDTMSHMPLTNDLKDPATGEYDYTRIFANAAVLTRAADYAVANLETVLAGGPRYSGFPTFNSPDAVAGGLAGAGFDLCLTANNHCLDQGFDGLCRTLDVLDEAGLAHVGTSRTQEEADAGIVLADVGGISVAFLGYTYGTNGLPLPKAAPYAVNVFNNDYLTTLADPDYDRMAADLAAAEALEPDLVAVLIHWGVEYQTTPNAHQTDVADFLFAHGADLVLGGHPHVLQPMELRTLDDGRQGFVCYSLGNFTSTQNSRLTDTTVVLTLELTRDNVTGVTEVTGYGYTPFYMLDREAGASPRYDLLNAHEVLDAGTADPELERKLAKAVEDCHTILGPEHDAWPADP